MYIETRIVPRFSDTDAAGHINNTAVTQWLESGRFDFNLRCLPDQPAMMLRRIEVDYDREMTHLREAHCAHWCRTHRQQHGDDAPGNLAGRHLPRPRIVCGLLL